MEYRLEIYEYDDDRQAECIKVFTSSAPFSSPRIGELLDASNWEWTRYKHLRVLTVEHAIEEKLHLGIDPSGGIINRTLIHTQGILYKGGRNEPHPPLHIER